MNSAHPTIDPRSLAFDIDGVVADTMQVFVRLAHERYGLTAMSLEDISCYNLYDCLELEKEIIDDLVCLTLDDEHTLQIPPLPDAAETLTMLAEVTPLRFVTARIWPESITEWIIQTLPLVPPERIEVIASGAPEVKIHILRRLGVQYFVEDRIETCLQLKEAGIQPFLFDQPWNRNHPADGCIRVDNWRQLQEWVLPLDVNLR